MEPVLTCSPFATPFRKTCGALSAVTVELDTVPRLVTVLWPSLVDGNRDEVDNLILARQRVGRLEETADHRGRSITPDRCTAWSARTWASDCGRDARTGSASFWVEGSGWPAAAVARRPERAWRDGGLRGGGGIEGVDQHAVGVEA